MIMKRRFLYYKPLTINVLRGYIGGGGGLARPSFVWCKHPNFLKKNFLKSDFCIFVKWEFPVYNACVRACVCV